MNERFLKADVATVAAEIHRLQELYPEVFEDEAFALDTIEGETDFHKIISRLLSLKRDDDIMAAGCKQVAADTSERARRFERKSEGHKGLIQLLMNAANIEKLPLPEATISVTSPRSKVEILSVDALPQGYFRTEKKADLKAIKEALEAGDDIPGAQLSIGAHGLMIRSK